MARRSLRASTAGLQQADNAFKLKGWTQEYLAGTVGCTRQVIISFFARRPVDQQLFQAICTELGLEWGDIAELEAGEEPKPSFSIDELVQTVRENIKESIQEKCGSMRVLEMSQSIGLDDIYTTVNILEKITGRRRLEIADLLKGLKPENFERFSLSDVREKQVPGLDAVNQYSKLMILGKPGAGKTTFLKYLAIQCSGGTFKPELVPIFITLKDFAEVADRPSLLDYLIQLFATYGVEPATKVNSGSLNESVQGNTSAVEQLLRQGRMLMLLDGLDEVKKKDSRRVLSQIQEFANQFRNPFVITCRIAAQEYTFENFTEVEVADFDDQQIATFTNKWFQAKQDPVKAKRFTQKLKEEWRIRDLASNPLMLTLLCLVFEESGSFPSNRSELYAEGLGVLLKKWDAKRNIERDQIYKNLFLKRKQDLLSQIALNAFEQGNYLLKQKEVEREIVHYIRNLPEVNSAEETLQLDSEAVLKSIEAQHGLFVERARGIYSFSHLTFHEYFAARKIVSRSHLDPSWAQLTTNITEKRWREVFLLTVGMLDSADNLLQGMKRQIDRLLAEDKTFRDFLTWVEQKAGSVNAPYKPAAVRAFYFSLDLDRERTLDRTLDRTRALDRAISPDLDPDLAIVPDLDPELDLNTDLALDLNLVRTFARARALALDPDRDQALTLASVLNLIPNRILTHDQDHELQSELCNLQDHLPNPSIENPEPLRNWWQTDGTIWIEQLMAIMINHRNISHDWQFSDNQKNLLQQYYDANKLLVDCLNSDCYVTQEVRQQIEGSLLSPVNQQE